MIAVPLPERHLEQEYVCSREAQLPYVLSPSHTAEIVDLRAGCDARQFWSPLQERSHLSEGSFAPFEKLLYAPSDLLEMM